jgi:hypothetical protein
MNLSEYIADLAHGCALPHSDDHRGNHVSSGFCDRPQFLEGLQYGAVRPCAPHLDKLFPLLPFGLGVATEYRDVEVRNGVRESVHADDHSLTRIDGLYVLKGLVGDLL